MTYPDNPTCKVVIFDYFRREKTFSNDNSIAKFFEQEVKFE